MKRVKFVSYDGKYPNLCSGTLVLEIDGKLVDSVKIESGGSCGCSLACGMDDVITYGKWEVYTLPEEYEDLVEEIEEVVNENIPLGCCGGCI